MPCRRLQAQTPPGNLSSEHMPVLTSSSSVDTYPNSPGGEPDPSGSIKSGQSLCDVKQLKACLREVGSDQIGIWTSPFHLHFRDALWLLPLAGATAVSLHYDVQTLQHVSASPNSVRISSDLSNLGAFGFVGAAGATYVIGKITKNEKTRETGVLSLEALADASLVTEVLKLATNRERPYTGAGLGRFWPDGSSIYTTNGSFPSEHSTIVWAFSHVIVDETPGHRWLHLALYAVAAGVSAARVTGRNHFPSDVVVGSGIGYLVGGFVYRKHSDSFDGGNLNNQFTVSPAFDAARNTSGIGITINPNVLRPSSLKQLWSKAFFHYCAIEKELK
jgi:membrane-associated phospholipid phosphatase